MLVGACDALATPRTLGPLRDLTPFVGPRLAGALRSGDREEVFESLRDELETAPGTVLVVEDVHWSDEATLDALRFLARRIDELPVVLVLTYRDDELDGGHPLTRLLGDVHTNVRHVRGATTLAVRPSVRSQPRAGSTPIASSPSREATRTS